MNNEFERFTISQKVILIREGKCLITEISDRPGVWDLPGGRIDKGEDEKESLRREMKEELGITDYAVLGVVDFEAFRWPSGNVSSGVVRLIDSAESVTISSEHSRSKWISEGEIGDYQYIWPTMDRMILSGFKMHNSLRNGR